MVSFLLLELLLFWQMLCLLPFIAGLGGWLFPLIFLFWLGTLLLQRLSPARRWGFGAGMPALVHRGVLRLELPAAGVGVRLMCPSNPDIS